MPVPPQVQKKIFLNHRRVFPVSQLVTARTTAFDYATDPRLAFWIDADDASTYTVNGSNQVSPLTDKSPNGTTLVATGGRQPFYDATIINGKPGFNFVPGKSIYTTNGALKDKTYLKMFAVIKVANDSTQQNGSSRNPYNEIFSIGNWASKNLSFGGTITGTGSNNTITGIKIFDSGSQSQALGANSDRTGYLADEIFIAEFEVGVDGTKISRGAANIELNHSQSATISDDFSPDALGITADNIILGGVYNNSSPFGFFEGAIAEIVMFDQPLTASETQSMRNQLEAKWGFKSLVDADLFLFSGQSNMEANPGGDPADLTIGTADVTTLTDDVLVSIRGDYIHRLNNLLSGESNGLFGPEQSFIRTVAASTGRPAMAVKYAVGGTPLSSWDPDLGVNGQVFDGYIDQTLEIAGGFGYNLIPQAMVWCQGEFDALNETDSNTYGSRLASDIIAKYRAIPGIGNVDFIAIQIATNGSPAFRETVRSQTASTIAADGNGILIGTDAVPIPDGIHFSADGIWQIGITAANGWLTQTNQNVVIL